MAYTIISQNNSTTTLSDGVNTITVPSRVNLTSGNFTIVEVNNNMATLEDGDGNVYRDIPCVATLAGEGGGGGSGLPDQTGHSGEFLTTDGTDASWASVDALQNTATGTDALTILGTASSYNQSVNVGYNSQTRTGGVAIGYNASVSSNGSVAIGQTSSSSGGVSVGYGTQSSKSGSVAIGYNVASTGNYAIQLGSYANSPYINTVNSENNTFKVGLGMGTNYKLLDSDGTIPTARFTTDPVADGTYYPTLTISSGTPTRSWSTISALQNTATGTDSLTLLGTGTTSQRSINIGVGSSIDSNNNVAIGHQATIGANTYSNVIAGMGATVTTNKSYNVAIGASSHASSGSEYGVAIGANTATAAKGAIQIGNATGTTKTNSDANTFKVGNANGNYEMMSADGTIPTARLTKVNSTITLTAAGWSGGSQTVSVSGVTSTSVVLVAPDPSDTADYVSAGILCTAQAANSLTFTATTTPTSDIDVNIVCL